MLSPHPPQIHSFLRSLGLLDSEHPQEANWPSRQPRDILCTTPAEATALAKAASCKKKNKEKNPSNFYDTCKRNSFILFSYKNVCLNFITGVQSDLQLMIRRHSLFIKATFQTFSASWNTAKLQRINYFFFKGQTTKLLKNTRTILFYHQVAFQLQIMPQDGAKWKGNGD